MQIIPTTGLKQDFWKVEERVGQLKLTSRWIQVDVCDNVFTSGKTFELELINRIEGETENILWDVHLMVKEPIDWLQKCMFIGAARVIGQVEIMEDRGKFVEAVKNQGLEVGLAFDIETEIEEIPEEVDVVLLMGRKAGFKSFDFNEKVFEKIKKTKDIREAMGRRFLIAVDGGVNPENIKILEEAGVDMVYSEENYFKLINDN